MVCKITGCLYIVNLFLVHRFCGFAQYDIEGMTRCAPDLLNYLQMNGNSKFV